ncbi:uncharacterized protein PFL1_02644 [Pseudozyma flocculosa PF-1]|uniref:Secreted protein n=2 Tax=Pseudozyma flocculosa TaxID=84751 RepID=A0A5C3F071_9BASI|nr:uncharacterized protein PFL1_02644 [Pseudozyma flocculosa PF-1]EPQ29971.1 hypothetical protein PFL1_02644 [Pseudozyma flocculosa PF-1]SPO37286.1 uncharacterized protein PSFLO_02759 [Pseudozyma flocculosa]
MGNYLRLLAVLLPLLAVTVASPLPDFDLDAIAELPTPTSIPADVAYTVIDVATAVQSVLATATPAAAIKGDLLEGAQEAEENAAAPTVSVTTLRKRADPKTLYPNLPAGNYVDTAQWPAGNFTPADFQGFAPYTSAASGASVPGWTKAYTGLKSVRGNMPGVLRISTYSTYDPAAMAAKCNTIANCASFAMWYERTPTAAPSDAVPNPQPAVAVKTLFYSYPLNAADATNDGQWQKKFWRTQTGVAFFNNNAFAPKNVPGYASPVSLPGAIHLRDAQVAANGGVDPLIATPGPMSGIPDPAVCKAICDKYTADPAYFNGIKKNCNEFNIFLLALNGQATGWQCQYYTGIYGAEIADNTGGYDGKGNHVQVIGSWTYNASPQLTPYVRERSADCGRKNIEHRGSCTQVQDWYEYMGDDADTVGFYDYDNTDFTARTINGWQIANLGYSDALHVCETYPRNGDDLRNWVGSSLPGPHFMECFSSTTWNAQGFTADLISMTFVRDATINAYRNGVLVSSFDGKQGTNVALPADWTGITSFSSPSLLRFTDFKMVRHYGTVQTRSIDFDATAAGLLHARDDATNRTLALEGTVYEIPPNCQIGAASVGICGSVVTDPTVKAVDVSTGDVVSASA